MFAGSRSRSLPGGDRAWWAGRLKLRRGAMVGALALLFAALPIARAETPFDSAGREFWLAFHTPGSALELYVTGEAATSGTVEVPGLGFSETFTVTPGEVTTIRLPIEANLTSDLCHQAANRAVHVTALDEITVHAANLAPANSDTLLGLPVDALGTEHFILAYPTTFRNASPSRLPGSGFAVAATEDGTSVTITTPRKLVCPDGSSSLEAGVPHIVVLDRGQVYFFEDSQISPGVDASGTEILSDKPVAVFGGHKCTIVPDRHDWCDQLVEQLPPVPAWGRSFVTSRLAPFGNTHRTSDTFRVLAAENGTTLRVNGVVVATLGRGQFHQFSASAGAHIGADKPVLVVQYAHSSGPSFSGASVGDPMMMVVPPLEQVLGRYTVTTPSLTGYGRPFDVHFVNLIASDAAVGKVFLDGTPIPEGAFAPVASSGYSSAQIEIDPGSHRLESPSPFGLFQYGWATHESYGHPGGMSVSRIATLDSLTLEPESETLPERSLGCVTATVGDADGEPLAGIRIDFAVTGANPRKEFRFSDASGEAGLCYRGARPGADTITARAGQLSATATKDWIDVVDPPVLRPGDPVCRAKEAKANVAWGPIVGATGYRVYRHEGATATLLGEVQRGVYADFDLTDGDTYTYTVRALEAFNEVEVESGNSEPCAGTPNERSRTGNRRPGITSAPPRAADEGDAYAYDADATDPDGDALTFSLPAAPAGMSIDPSSGVVQWSIPPGSGGEHVVTVRATDGEGNAGTQSYLLTVQGPNAPPEIVSTPVTTATAGEGYAYDVEATDPNPGEVLTFSLDVAPAGMTIHPATGLVEWTPSGADTGDHDVTVRATDSRGLFDTQSYVLTVRAPNAAPQITSTPVTRGQANVPYRYDVEASDPNPGDVLTYSLDQSPAGMTIDGGTGVIDWLPSGADTGEHPVTVRVSDGGGLSDTQAYVVTIAAANAPPAITSTPPTGAVEDSPYTYDVEATDPNAGDVLTFSLDQSPAGMTIDSASGLIQWTPGAADVGDNPVTVRVTDSGGLFDTQGYVIRVAEKPRPPEITSAPPTRATPGVEYRYDVEATDPNSGDTLVFSLDTSPSGMTIDPASGLVAWTPTNGQIGSHPVTVRVTDSSGLFDTQSYRITVAPDTEPPQVTVTVSPGIADPDEPVTVTVTATDDVGVVSVTLEIDGEPTPLDQNNQATFSSPVPGSFTAVGRATDAEGNEGTGSALIRVRDVNDTIPPTVSLDLPDDLAEVTFLTDLIGTATDDNLAFYRLGIAPADSTGSFTEFARETTPVQNDVLGVLDPTLLENGLYRVRLEAEDLNGQRASVDRIYKIDGEAKVGVFRISFLDLNVPVVGVPISVVRTYDSRKKTGDDFGIGWSLDVRAGSYRHNRKPGLGWQFQSRGTFPNLPCWTIDETRTHLTEFRLSDREVYRFALMLQNPAATTGGCFADASFEFVDGSIPDATLTILGNTEVLWEDGTDHVVDSETFLTYDPGHVVLTTVDGRRYEFEVTAGGITRIGDPNGNTLTIDDDGITHSSGKSIFFERDGQGRITTITDPMGNTLQYDYDPAGDLVAFTDQVGSVTTFTYDGRHNLIEIFDPLGNRAYGNEYDADGRLVAIIDAKGNRIEISRDLDGREELVSDALGNLTRVLYDEQGYVSSREQVATIEGVSVPVRTLYEHDDLGNETVVVDPDGRRTEATYDNVNLLEEVIDPSGLAVRTTQTFDARGDLRTQTDPESNVMSYGYDLRGNITTFTDALGNTRSLTYDLRGRPTDFEDPAGSSQQLTHDSSDNVIRHEQLDAGGALLARTDYTYDANGNRLTETVFRTIGGAERALTTTFAYDAKGRLVSTTDPLGNVSRTEYNALGLESARIDALGRRTTFIYDEVGALVRTDFPDGTSEAIEYDALGNVIRRTNRGGEATLHAYDELRREIRLTGPDGSSTETLYSPGGRITAVIDSAGHRTDYEYDSAGRRTRALGPVVFDAASGTTVRPETIEEYDQNGRLVGRTDPNGNNIRFVYEGTHHVVRREFPDGTVRRSRYDALDRVVEEIDEAGRSTSFAYDALGRLTAVTDALGGVTTYAYDEVGNLLSATDARGNTTGYEYDELGRLVRKTLPGGATETLEYDAVGRLVARTDFNGDTVLFTYDLADRLLERLYPDGSKVTFTYTASGRRQSVTDDRGVTAYQYDAGGRLVRITHPGGEQLQYGYDASGRLASLASPAQTVSYAYDSHGRLAEVGSPDGNAVYGYDRGGRLVRLAAANGIATTYSYDARNRASEVRHLDGPTPVASFAYDLSPTGRRTRMTELDGSVETYTYDALDRLVGESRTGSDPRSITYEYDAVSNRTRMARDGAETTYSYDEDDRLLSAGGTTYTYDANGNLTARAEGSDTTAYGWDFDDRLVSAVSGAGSAGFEYDADGNRVAIDGPSGSASHLVTPLNPSGLPQVLEERDGSGGLLAAYTYGRDLLAMERGGGSSFYHYDAHGSTRLLTNAGGSVSDTYVYEGYGSRTSSTGATTNPYLYTGEQFDPGLGLYHLRARYYDPVAGRFLGRDPAQGRLRDPRSRHPHLYAHADPVNLRDPTGRETLLSLSIASIEHSGLQVSEWNWRAATLCGLKGKVKAFEQLAIISLALPSIIVAMSDLDTGALGDTKVGVGRVLYAYDVKANKDKDGIQKFELRLFSDEPLQAGPPSQQRQNTVVAAFDAKVQGVNVKIRGSYNVATRRARVVDLGVNAPLFELSVCGVLPIFKLELAVRQEWAAEFSRLAAEATVLGTAGFKLRYPLFPANANDAGQ